MAAPNEHDDGRRFTPPRLPGFVVPTRFLIVSACLWTAWFGISTLMAGFFTIVQAGRSGTGVHPGWWTVFLPAAFLFLLVYLIARAGICRNLGVASKCLRAAWITIGIVTAALCLGPVAALAIRAWWNGEPLGPPFRDGGMIYWLIYSGVAMIFALPALVGVMVADKAVRRRLCRHQASRDPRLAWPHQRYAATVGMLMTIGAFAVLFAAMAPAAIAPVSLSAERVIRAWFHASLAVPVGAIIGAVVGSVGSLWLARADPAKTLPRIAVVTGVTGVALSLIAPLPLAALGMIAAAIPVGIIAARSHPLFGLGLCAGCGYDLSGLLTPICPECGMTAPALDLYFGSRSRAIGAISDAPADLRSGSARAGSGA